MHKDGHLTILPRAQATEVCNEALEVCMGFVRSMPQIEAWLDADADSWESLSDQDYQSLVHRWQLSFAPLVNANAASASGERALFALEKKLPTDVYVISGVQVPLLANTGGYGASAYIANGLRGIDRDIASHEEVIVVSVDFRWSCVFSHEPVHENLFEQM